MRLSLSDMWRGAGAFGGGAGFWESLKRSVGVPPAGRHRASERPPAGICVFALTCGRSASRGHDIPYRARARSPLGSRINPRGRRPVVADKSPTVMLKSVE